MGNLTGKAALVTGASRGIGAAIAKRLAADGARVLVHYARNEEAATRIVSEIQAAGGEAMTLGADFPDYEQIAALFERIWGHIGRLDVLVNNAGIAEFLPLTELEPEHVERLLAVNVYAPSVCAMLALPLFPPSGGRIINISSGAAQAAPSGASIYAASKAALECLTKSWAQELGPRQITVNAIAPGTTESDMLREVMSAEQQAAMVAATPLGRLGTPEDIAAVVAFLASEDARWITGQVIGVSGGLK